MNENRKNRANGQLPLGMAHKFVVMAGTRNLGAWSKVSGLSVTWDVAEHRVGDSDAYFKYAGVPKFEKLKLARAADSAGTQAVQKWLADVKDSGGEPEEGSLQMQTSAGEEIVTFPLYEMFPMSWQISEFDAGSSKVAVETLTIIYFGFLQAGGGGKGGGGKRPVVSK